MAEVLGIFISEGGVPKLPIDSVEIGYLGLAGDSQQNKKFHGGRLRAVCVLENELLLKLQNEGHPILPGRTGENLLVEGYNLEIGSIFTVGTAELQVVSATSPCYKIADSFIEANFNRISHEKNPGETRWYCKILKTGTVRISS
jgi:MOSC domain-containing protein YiiM